MHIHTTATMMTRPTTTSARIPRTVAASPCRRWTIVVGGLSVVLAGRELPWSSDVTAAPPAADTPAAVAAVYIRQRITPYYDACLVTGSLLPAYWVITVINGRKLRRTLCKHKRPAARQWKKNIRAERQGTWYATVFRFQDNLVATIKHRT